MFKNFGLYTDFYELSMAQGYFFCGKKEQHSSFDYFFRSNPFSGGFTVFAGLDDFLDMLERFKYSSGDLEYLEMQGFKPEFLKWLESFSFRGNIHAVNEGEIVFPGEPLVVVEGNLIECQLIESLLLNILNFETLVATKAFRIKLVSEGKPFADFGLRRAQGLASVHASRAASIGGASSTSNVLAGKIFGIPVSGTQAHSWIQSFDDELTAFREYAHANPYNTILLVDTYNTLTSGVPNAIKVAKEMEAIGLKMKAIRLDSGDLAYLSKKSRQMLDREDLHYIKIIASNQLNENVIKTLLKDQEAKIDAFGIGTELITGKNDAALDGVYKLTEIDSIPKMKFSENVEKITLPGKKKLVRYLDSEGKFFRDGILTHSEQTDEIQEIYHPVYSGKFTNVQGLDCQELLIPVMENGRVLPNRKTTQEIHKYLLSRALMLPDEHKRFISPHLYKTGISKRLMEIRNSLTVKNNNLR